MADRVTIASDCLTASINPLGAELTSLTDAAGRELLTDADPAFWAGRAPLLFPIVGRVRDDRYRLDGREYAMPKHGFARRSTFDLVDASAAEATFRLTDSADTRALYPFAFALTMRFAVDGATLSMAATVANRGDGPMPASFGYHPAFAWPLPYGARRADHRVTFDVAQPGPLRAITPDGLIAPDPRPSPLLDDRRLLLEDDLFADDALVWDPVEARGVTYGTDDGPQLDICFPDATQLGIWTKPGARFVCIEPWNGIADPAGFTGDFADKPGMMRLAPGEERTLRMAVTLRT